MSLPCSPFLFSWRAFGCSVAFVESLFDAEYANEEEAVISSSDEEEDE
jgi:hypothetical protein